MAAINFLRGQDTLAPGTGDSGAVKESPGKGAHGALKLCRSLGPQWERMFLSYRVRNQSRTLERQGYMGAGNTNYSPARGDNLKPTRRATESSLFVQLFWASEARSWASAGNWGMPVSEENWHCACFLFWGTSAHTSHQRGNSGHDPVRRKVGGHRPSIKIYLEQVFVQRYLPIPLMPVSTIPTTWLTVGYPYPSPSCPSHLPPCSLNQLVIIGSPPRGRLL